MKPFLKLKSVTEVEKIIFNLPFISTESVSLENVFGRRLACDFYAPENLPGFRRSTMDGYAVHARDIFGASETNPALLTITGSCSMGKMPDFSLDVGYAAPILTGAPLPAGADAVVMVEHTRPAGKNDIEVTRPVAPGMNIVQSDDDAKKGQKLIARGKLLRAQEVGILAAFGISSISVFKKPRVAILSTGDEVRPAASPIAPGEVRDVNSYTLKSICLASSALPTTRGITGDNPRELASALAAASAGADVILVSGGSSAGMRDHTMEAFLTMPDSRVLVQGVAISPGKPFILAAASATILVGLPGHVSGALVCAHVFVAPLLNHLQGMAEPALKPYFLARLCRSVASAQGRRDYIRVKLIKRDGETWAEPLTSPSAVLSGLLQADAYIVCPENSEGFEQGAEARAYPV